MNGYIRNRTPVYKHALKRAIGPGSTVSLDELHEQYGKKHDIPKGEQFARWLREVKLQDSVIWEIVCDDAQILNSNLRKEEKSKQPDNVVPMVVKNITIEDVVAFSVKKGREELPKIVDVKLLTYALKQANGMANKDTLCIMLRKRLKELEI